ncbi:MAG: hypothetical protein COV46_07895 [Deltaproteobacteria bacterium CG11_big_fil_rev_8_21_14_0_20_49_13]|nr:MAG: hypothetical protein COV46_07895 [Deltaproteobacteria bacterium CG11_big_fil_rev_8_21_14_0_20_49_13]
MAEKETLVVVSKVKDYVKSKGMMTSAEAVPALSDKVYALIDEAINRTKENRRQTIKPQDL